MDEHHQGGSRAKRDGADRTVTLFAPYDRQLMALAMLVLLVLVFFGFNQEEMDAISDSRRRNRR